MTTHAISYLSTYNQLPIKRKDSQEVLESKCKPKG